MTGTEGLMWAARLVLLGLFLKQFVDVWFLLADRRQRKRMEAMLAEPIELPATAQLALLNEQAARRMDVEVAEMERRLREKAQAMQLWMDHDLAKFGSSVPHTDADQRAQYERIVEATRRKLIVNKLVGEATYEEPE